MAPPAAKPHSPGIVWIAAAVIALLGCGAISAWTIIRLGDSHRHRLQEHDVALTRIVQGLTENWRARRLDEVRSWAKEPLIVRDTEALVSGPHTPAALLGNPAQSQLRGLLGPFLVPAGYRGMFVIARDGSNLASMRDANVGTKTLLHVQPDVLKRAWAGASTMSRPQQTDVPLQPAGRTDTPTMFVLAPIRARSGAVIALLGFRIEPGAMLSDLLATARTGDTGEVYLVDPKGRLITRSRFERKLQLAGQIEPGQSSVFHVAMRRPSDGAPTRPMRDITRGRNGASSEPYESYTGDHVVGAWLCDAEHGVAIVSEQNADEAYALLHETSHVVTIALLLIALAGAAVVFVTRRASHRAHAWAERATASEADAQRAATAARASALSLEEAQQLTDVGSGICDLDSGAVLWSAAAVDHLGDDLPERADHLSRLADRFAPEEQRAIQALLQRALEEPIQVEMRAVCPTSEDSNRFLQLRVRSTARDHGRPDHVVITVQDTTARETREQALAELRQRLSNASRDEALGRLAGGIAHDFNNILMVCLTSSELLLERVGADPAARDCAETIVNAARRGADITRQILEFASASDLASTTEINAAIRSLSRLFSAVLGEQIALRLTLDDRIGHVLLPTSHFDQILMNLVVNARDALPTGGTVEIQTRLLPDIPNVKHHMVELAVRDDGVGMSKEQAEHAFDRLYTTKGPGEGFGLGLATVRDLVQRAGGTINVESTLGAGSTFFVRLPAAVLRRKPPPQPTPPKQMPEHRAHVLLVEDEASLRVLLARALREQGYAVEEAGSAEAALEWTETDPESAQQIELLLTDVVLPRMNGAVLAARFREFQPDLRVLFMSGYAANKLTDEDLARPHTAFLAKPFTTEELLDQIGALLATADTEASPGGGEK